MDERPGTWEPTSAELADIMDEMRPIVSVFAERDAALLPSDGDRPAAP